MKQNKVALIITILFLIISSIGLYIHRPTTDIYFFDKPFQAIPGETKPYKEQVLLYGDPGLYTRQGMLWDAAHTYAQNITNKGRTNNWHSALYMYEMRFLSIFTTLIGCKNDGVVVQILVWHLGSGCVLLSLSLLLYYLLKKSIIYILFAIPCAVSHYYLADWMWLNLDYFFFVCFILLLLSVVQKPHSKRKAILLAVLVAILLFHACNFRKNAVVLVPLFSTFYAFKYCHSLISKIIFTFGTTVIFSALCLFGVTSVLPVHPSEPTIPMLSSTLRVAHELRGDRTLYDAKLTEIGGRKNQRHFGRLAASDQLDLRSTSTGHLTEAGRSFYKNEWRVHPGTMLCAHIIQVVEFYCGGEMLVGKGLVEYLYPAVKVNPQAWVPTRNTSGWIVYTRLFLLALSLALTALLAFRSFRKKKALTFLDTPLAFVGGASLIYAASFALVPPTADIRYLTPSIYIAWNTLWLFAAAFISARKTKVAPLV